MSYNHEWNHRCPSCGDYGVKKNCLCTGCTMKSDKPMNEPLNIEASHSFDTIDEMRLNHLRFGRKDI